MFATVCALQSCEHISKTHNNDNNLFFFFLNVQHLFPAELECCPCWAPWVHQRWPRHVVEEISLKKTHQHIVLFFLKKECIKNSSFWCDKNNQIYHVCHFYSRQRPSPAGSSNRGASLTPHWRDPRDCFHGPTKQHSHYEQDSGGCQTRTQRCEWQLIHPVSPLDVGSVFQQQFHHVWLVPQHCYVKRVVVRHWIWRAQANAHRELQPTSK